MFCIPKKNAVELVKEIKKLGFDKFSNMTTKERQRVFLNHVERDMAKELEESFTEALEQDDLRAVITWAKKNLNPQQVKEVEAIKKEDLMESIKNGTVNEDLARKKLGVDLTSAEIKEFTRMGKELFDLGERLQEAGLSDAGNVLSNKSYEAQIAYFKKANELESYAQSISPNSGIWERYTKNIWKAGILLSAKTIGLNLFGNLTVLAGERMVDRITNKSLGLAMGKEKAIYAKRVLSLYNQTGFDLSRSTGLSAKDTVIGAGRYANEPLATPKSQFMQYVSKFVFEKALGLGDVSFAAVHRADSVGILAEVLAKKGNVEGFEGLTGKQLMLEIFKDGTRMEPRTEAGLMIRDISIHNARVGTYTNETQLTEASVAIKRTLNKAGNIGEILMPFVKTPTNVIGLSLDYGGTGIPRVITQTARSLVDSKYALSKAEFDRNITSIVRAGLGLSLVSLIFAMIEDDDEEDYVGAYQPNETQSRNIKGATPDSVKIGGKYYSLDYFGVLRSPLKLRLELKKQEEWTTAVLSTLASEVLNLPIFSATGATNTIEAVQSSDGKIDKVLEKMPEKIVNHVYSGIPLATQVGDITKAMDENQRDTTTETYSLAGLSFDKIAEKIPMLRTTLPEKVTVLGDNLETVGGLNVLTGARASNAVDTPVVKEYRKLEDAGFAPRFTDIMYSKSTKVARIEGKIGRAALNDEKKALGKSASDKIAKFLKDERYIKLESEDRQEFQQKLFEKEYEAFLEKHGEGKATKFNEQYYFNKFEKNKSIVDEATKKILREKSFDGEDGLISRIMVYAKSLKVDPAVAFDRILSGQKIRRIDSGAIIVERMPTGGNKGSQAVRAERGFDGDDGVKLDHTIPLQLGGSNAEDNLKIVSTAEHAAYSKKENELGRLLRDNEISKAEAQRQIKEFKANFDINAVQTETSEPAGDQKQKFMSLPKEKQTSMIKALIDQGFTKEEIRAKLGS